MHGSLRYALSLALVLLVLGCNPSWLTVGIPDFGSKQVEGVWIWRLSPETNRYERDTLVAFQGVTTFTKGQILGYATYAIQGDASLTAAIAHDPANPDGVTLTLGFQRGLPGVFKVSTFNAAGESPLSGQSKSL